MTFRADDLIERRRLRRKLTFWRVAAFLVLALALAGLSAWFYRGDLDGSAADHIAKVKIEGTITQNDELVERLEKIRKSPRVKGVILAIDSPGGTTAGGESIYEEVRKLAADKPVWPRWARSPPRPLHDRQRHRPYRGRQSSIVGSIGVLIRPRRQRHDGQVGIKLEEVKSAPLKPSPRPSSTRRRRGWCSSSSWTATLVRRIVATAAR